MFNNELTTEPRGGVACHFPLRPIPAEAGMDDRTSASKTLQLRVRRIAVGAPLYESYGRPALSITRDGFATARIRSLAKPTGIAVRTTAIVTHPAGEPEAPARELPSLLVEFRLPSNALVYVFTECTEFSRVRSRARCGCGLDFLPEFPEEHYETKPHRIYAGTRDLIRAGFVVPDNRYEMKRHLETVLGLDFYRHPAIGPELIKTGLVAIPDGGDVQDHFMVHRHLYDILRTLDEVHKIRARDLSWMLQDLQAQLVHVKEQVAIQLVEELRSDPSKLPEGLTPFKAELTEIKMKAELEESERDKPRRNP